MGMDGWMDGQAKRLTILLVNTQPLQFAFEIPLERDEEAIVRGKGKCKRKFWNYL